MSKTILYITIYLTSTSVLFHQELAAQKKTHDFSFVKNISIQVKNLKGETINFPWAGGLGACQFGSIDLNNDSILDLIVFERNSKKLLPFTNNNITDSCSYTFSPEHSKSFPQVKEWVQFKDYNMDGLTDLFTYTTGGIKVYRNISTSTQLKFELVSSLLTSLQYSGQVNIPVTSVDYPSIEDIDNDGDLDILTFFGLGSFVQLHKNQSIENYNNPDHLEFIRTENCWGKFKESEESNTIELNIACPYKKNNQKHTGSTLLAIDLDGDKDKDLLLGDIDYLNLYALKNGGSTDSAVMINIDTTFPSYSTPIEIVSFPVASFIDINNDNLKDLIISPFNPNPEQTQSSNNVLLYLNNGDHKKTDFRLQKSSFLQSDMIDVGIGAYPVFFDFNNDSLIDIVISNYGHIDSTYLISGNLYTNKVSQLALYQNTGSHSYPEFTLVSDNYANLGQYKLTSIYPCFYDLDKDGDTDLLCGESGGKLILFDNIAGKEHLPEFKLITDFYHNIDVGEFSTPQLIDIDQDSLPDLIIGEKNGNINYFNNIGNSNTPSFSLITENFGNVDVTDYTTSWYGYSTPRFFFNTQDSLVLFTGSSSGKIPYYKNTNNHSDSSFLLIEESLLDINEGTRTSLDIRDINNDGLSDMIIGNFSGGLGLYFGDSAFLYNKLPIHQAINCDLSISLYPNPADDFINISLNKNRKLKTILFELYSATGKLILSFDKEYKQEICIITSAIPDGLYYSKISIRNNNCNVVTGRKLVIIH